jgi:hypothetical protein
MTDAKRTQPPAPSPDTVTASRHHLTAQYASGVDRVLWEAEKRPMPDADAVRALVSAAANGDQVDALGIGAALVLTQAMRLDLDLLEADVLDAAQASGISPESLAAVLELPNAGLVEARHRMLAAKRELPRAAVEPVTMSPGTPREAADRAGRRASQAARRAAQAKRRVDELARAGERTQVGTGASAAPASSPELVEQAAANAGEARLNAKEATELVALGLPRAADALERCAVQCEEQDGGTTGHEDSEGLRKRAQEYVRAAHAYREMAGRYRDIGRLVP